MQYIIIFLIMSICLVVATVMIIRLKKENFRLKNTKIPLIERHDVKIDRLIGEVAVNNRNADYPIYFYGAVANKISEELLKGEYIEFSTTVDPISDHTIIRGLLRVVRGDK